MSSHEYAERSSGLHMSSRGAYLSRKCLILLGIRTHQVWLENIAAVRCSLDACRDVEGDAPSSLMAEKVSFQILDIAVILVDGIKASFVFMETKLTQLFFVCRIFCAEPVSTSAENTLNAKYSKVLS